MLRTGVLCCAMAGVLALAIGCNSAVSKDETVKTMTTDVEKVEKQLAELKTKATQATGDEKIKLEMKHKEAVGKQEAFNKKFAELKTAAADKWEAVKKDADAAFAEFKKAVEQ
jgi:hypothetical protein